MTNYYMQSGAKRNKRIKLFKKILTILIILATVFMYMRWNNAQLNKIMEIEYCWDSNGDHYVAPDERCLH